MASLAPRSGTLGRRLAAHLLRRATFGATRTEIDSFASMTADQAVDALSVIPVMATEPIDPATNLTWFPAGRTQANSPNEDLKYIVNSWWLHHMMTASASPTLAHKLFFFLHTSFVTSFKDIEWNENHYYTIRLLNYFVDKSYKDLAFKICLDGGMNEFLDIGESVEGNPNENFAREFLELFTIGKGPAAGTGDYTTFTEQDVNEAARLLTGFRLNNDWDDPTRLDPVTGFPQAWIDPNKHDPTDKLFSARFQNTIIAGTDTAAGMLLELQQFVDMIFNQTATAEYIMRRLYRLFVHYHISSDAETGIIQPLAQSFIANNFEVLPVLKQLLKSEHFFDADDADATDGRVGALIKSPLELQTQIIRYFDVPLPDPAVDPFEAYVTFYWSGIQDPQSLACMDILGPSEVAGYPPVYQSPEFNRLWVGSKSIPARYALPDEHLDGPEILQMDVMAFVQDTTRITEFAGADANGAPGPHPGARIAPHLVQELVDYLMPEALPQARFDYFLNEILLDSLSEINWSFEWDLYLATLDDSNVKPQIKKLIRALLQSPEFQLG
ncbi:DUF1800 family protein [Pontibacter sp. G13]|uniref:DUF1800 family protein n=1 Tax=Pontibacter sp. G13 TaxID=3074898 RepID=UPI00288A504B|nr:DUF1800 family protein [Pontibacter sp. G13]WNJ20999.1 DUF1800 family protein [Pontibacter sp. G13]